MAEDFQDRSEPATPKRREDARKKGQIAYSPELVGAAVLLAGVVGLWSFGPGVALELVGLIRTRFMRQAPADLGVGEAGEMLGGQLADFVRVGLPLMALPLLAGILAGLGQTGFLLGFSRLAPDPERLSPAAGAGRMFSWSGVFKGVMGLVKVAVLAVLIYAVLRSRVGVFASLGQGDVPTAAALAWQLVLRVALSLSTAFLLLGLVEYAYQRYQLERSLRMTKQEVKDEVRREEGDPQVKQRMRRMQRDLARKGMLDEVPKATLVVTNPTHFAVAIRYDRRTMSAPRVIAKGAGDLAKRMAARARLHGVPVVERPPVARALYRGVGLGNEIPQDFFVAVAELIAFVYRLRGR